MSTTIDEKVVKMRFDNQQFESNVQTSLNTLDRLKKSLDMEGAAKGLEQVNDAAKRCDMSKLSGALETVQARFSSLEVMGGDRLGQYYEFGSQRRKADACGIYHRPNQERL